jgi:hypothetical protein
VHPLLKKAKRIALDAWALVGISDLVVRERVLDGRACSVVAQPTNPIEGNRDIQIHLSWNTHIACNYDCTYCFFHGHWDELAAHNKVRRPEEWELFWNRFNQRFGSARVDIAGGEPFTYPGFFRILRHLTRSNYASISTNLSWNVDPVIRQIDPKRVVLNASFHPEYADRDEFLEKVIRLRQAGFHISVSYVIWPRVWHRVPSDFAAFLKHGIYCGAQPFRGTFWGLKFPEDYGVVTKWLMKEMIEDRLWFRLIPSCPEYRDLETPRDDVTSLVVEYQLGRKSVYGKACNTGRIYFRLESDGRALRCAQGGFIGNVFDEDFALWSEARPCEFQKCECINEMLYVEGGPRGPERMSETGEMKPRLHLTVLG